MRVNTEDLLSICSINLEILLKILEFWSEFPTICSSAGPILHKL